MKTKTDGALTPVQTKLLGAVTDAKGIVGATDLAKKFHVTKARISYLAAGLIKSGWLRKNGTNYAPTSKAKKLTAQAESQTADGPVMKSSASP
jgi:DNA-binding IclR family transcriptional regulator